MRFGTNGNGLKLIDGNCARLFTAGKTSRQIGPLTIGLDLLQYSLIDDWEHLRQDYKVENLH